MQLTMRHPSQTDLRGSESSSEIGSKHQQREEMAKYGWKVSGTALLSSEYLDALITLCHSLNKHKNI